MTKSKYSKYLLFGFLMLISLLFLTSNYLHTEKNLEFEDNCPICVFERATTLFWNLDFFFVFFTSLLLIVFKISLKENEKKLSLFSHILGQRAPPLL